MRALLGVSLGAEPRDLAVAVDPVVGVCLAGEALDFALFAVRVIRQDFPVVVCNADGFEGHFCFCHAALCRRWPEKRTCLVTVPGVARAQTSGGQPDRLCAARSPKRRKPRLGEAGLSDGGEAWGLQRVRRLREKMVQRENGEG